MKMTSAEQDDMQHIVAIVMKAAEACDTPEATRDAGLNFVHGGAAVLVQVCGYGFTLDFLRKLIVTIEKDARAEQVRGLN